MPVSLPINSRYRYTAAISHKGHDTIGVWPGFNWVNDQPGQYVIATSDLVGRCDLIAMRYLGSTDLWWVIMYYNKITDINWPRAGDQVAIPDRASVLSMDASQSGQ